MQSDEKKRFWKEETLETFFVLTPRTVEIHFFSGDWFEVARPLVGAKFKKRPQTWHRLDTGSLEEETGNEIGILENKAA